MLVRTETFRRMGGGARPTVVGTPAVATSLSPTYPTGISNGDLLIFAQGVAGEAASVVSTCTLTAPGGWTNAADRSSAEGGTGRSVRIRIWKRTATGSESGLVSGFSRTGGAGIVSDICAIISIHGANATFEDIQNSNGQDNPVTAPSVTVAAAGRLGIFLPLYGDDSGNWTSFTGGSGADLSVLTQAGGAGGADRRMGVLSASLDASVSGKTESTARTADEWVVFGIALKPA